MSKTELARIIRVLIEDTKNGLFWATSPDLRGLTVTSPTIDELFEVIPQVIADLHEAEHGTRPLVLQAARGQDPMIHPWIVIPEAHLRLIRAAIAKAEGRPE